MIVRFKKGKRSLLIINIAFANNKNNNNDDNNAKLLFVILRPTKVAHLRLLRCSYGNLSASAMLWFKGNCCSFSHIIALREFNTVIVVDSGFHAVNSSMPVTGFRTLSVDFNWISDSTTPFVFKKPRFHKEKFPGCDLCILSLQNVM